MRLAFSLVLSAFFAAASASGAVAQVDMSPAPERDARPKMPAPAPVAPIPRKGEDPEPNAKDGPSAGQMAPEAAEKKPDTPQTEPEQRTRLLEELYGRLTTAPDEQTGAEIAAAIERLWQHSGSATADLLMARAAAATEAGRTELAMNLLNVAVELQPDYAEAWNRRAYLFYLDDNYTRALGDIRRVLALEPHHFKAIEGLANILEHLGEKKAALEAYETLLKVYPKAPGAEKARDNLRIEVEGRGI